MTIEKKCLVCGSTSEEMPLLTFEFKQQNLYVCSQHIPIIIHQPHQLQGLIPEMPDRGSEPHHED
ncbi:MAG: hypothetical protein KDC85_00670 [Saprospiraceae bacterium]|nr:hypothetical protein [Saprospiraceae bacterium]MCB9326056.1 hypothetical protein [Lewinellaceae bacterium]